MYTWRSVISLKFPSMRSWLKIACERPVCLRAAKVSFVVGTLLVAINQGDVLLSGEVTTKSLVKIILTYLVPYVVSTYAAVGATLEHRKDN